MNIIFRKLRNNLQEFTLPIILTLIIISSILYIDLLNPVIKQIFYSISLTIKDILVFLTPSLVAGYISSSIIKLGGKASWFLIFAMSCVLVSNLFSTFIAYGVSALFLQSGNYLIFEPVVLTDSLKPLWKFSLPKFLTNDHALFVGMTWGFASVYLKSSLLERLSFNLTNAVTFFLKRIFIPIVPIFVVGFFIKLADEGILSSITKDYAPIFLTMVIVQVLYLFVLYVILSNFSVSRLVDYINNVLPSVMTGFCTMSSAATIPMTMESAKKNTNNTTLMEMVVPGTASIHLIGDSISAPIMCLTVLQSFGYGFPSFYEYIIFSIHFALAKFFIAAVPGGGVIVMIPIIEAYLGFSPEMAAIVSAFYILFDPINTSINVAGNGAFAIFLSKMYPRIVTIQEKLTPFQFKIKKVFRLMSFFI